MSGLTGVHTDWNDILGTSRRLDERGLLISTFPLVDTFEGVLTDPQSLHKYLYTHGDPVNGIDPTGMFEGLVSGMVSMAMGATLGYIAMESIFGADVEEPTFGESLVPVYGASQEAIYNFQQGNYFIGAFHTGLALSDWLMVRAMFGFASKLLTKSALKKAGGEAAEVVFTKVPTGDAASIATDMTFKAGTEGSVYGAKMANAPWYKTLLNGKKAQGATIRWEGEAAELFGKHEVDGWFSGLKHRLFG